jgi:peptidyl-prolyl cis-trans isomerase C
VNVFGRLAVCVCVAGATAVLAQTQPAADVLMQGPAGAVTASDVEAAVQQYPLASRRSMLTRPEQVQRIAEDTYVRRALAREAETTGLDKDPLVQAMVQLARERILSEARMYEVGKSGWPAEEVLEKFAQEQYKAQPDRFMAKERVQARHILIAAKENTEAARADAKALAQTLLQQAKAGAAFAELATQHSADQATASRGGDLGLFELGTMVPAFEAALKDMSTAGQLSDVVETQFGYHVIRFERRVPAGVRPYDEVKPELVRQARDKHHRDAQQQGIAKIQSQAVGNNQAVEAVNKRYAAQ